MIGQKKKSKRVPIDAAIIVASARAIRKLYPNIRKLYLVGSRLRRPIGRDIEFVAEVPPSKPMPRRAIPNALPSAPFKVDVFFARPDEVDAHILQFGLGKDDIRWKRAAKARGLRLNRFGLWRGSVRIAGGMEEIAVLLGMPMKPFLLWSKRNPF